MVAKALAVSEFSDLPGGSLVVKGLKDLESRIVSEEALLVSMARPRLLALGVPVPELLGIEGPHKHALYDMIEARNPAGAHAAYNALVRRIVSFANAYSVLIRAKGRMRE